MSAASDTIRDYITNTERYDGQWHRLPTNQETLSALDVLLAENERLRGALAEAAALLDSPYRGTDHPADTWFLRTERWLETWAREGEK